MKEKQLEIWVERDNNGNEYKKIQVGKTRVDNRTGAIRQGLAKDEYVILEKDTYAEGLAKDMGSYKFYNCTAIYNGQQVRFTLSEQQHELWAKTGGVGDKIKAYMYEHKYTFKGEQKSTLRLGFEVVN